MGKMKKKMLSGALAVSVLAGSVMPAAAAGGLQNRDLQGRRQVLELAFDAYQAGIDVQENSDGSCRVGLMTGGDGQYQDVLRYAEDSLYLNLMTVAKAADYFTSGEVGFESLFRLGMSMGLVSEWYMLDEELMDLLGEAVGSADGMMDAWTMRRVMESVFLETEEWDIYTFNESSLLNLVMYANACQQASSSALTTLLRTDLFDYFLPSVAHGIMASNGMAADDAEAYQKISDELRSQWNAMLAGNYRYYLMNYAANMGLSLPYYLRNYPLNYVSADLVDWYLDLIDDSIFEGTLYDLDDGIKITIRVPEQPNQDVLTILVRSDNQSFQARISGTEEGEIISLNLMVLENQIDLVGKIEDESYRLTFTKEGDRINMIGKEYGRPMLRGVLTSTENGMDYQIQMRGDLYTGFANHYEKDRLRGMEFQVKNAFNQANFIFAEESIPDAEEILAPEAVNVKKVAEQLAAYLSTSVPKTAETEIAETEIAVAEIAETEIAETEMETSR